MANEIDRGTRVRLRKDIRRFGLIRGHEGECIERRRLALLGDRDVDGVLIRFPGRSECYLLSPADLEIVEEKGGT